jgi:RND family efflux transporter MFP subunit
MNLVKAILLTSVAAAIAGLGGCSADHSQPAPSLQTVPNLSVLAAQRTEVPDVLEAVGTIRAEQTSVLSSQMMGNVIEIRVQEGDRVQRGQVVAVIDDSQPHAAMDRANAAGNASKQQLAVADSDLTLAESTLKRYQNLFEKKSVSPQEFDEVKARQQTALARRDMALADQAQTLAALEQARTAFDYTRIRAPFDGVVTEKKVDSGTLASPGMPIVTIEDVRRYRLEANVNESDLAYVRIGQAVPVVIDALGDHQLHGKVVQIVPAADPASRSFLIKIELPVDPQLRSGFFAHAQFSHGARQSLLVPRTAIVERGQLQGVFVLDQNSVAGLRYVTLGKPKGNDVEVLAGLQEGEHLVVKPGTLELDGKQVEAKP